MQEKEWLSLVAIHSDAWLLTVAFYFGARFGFDKADKYDYLQSLCLFYLNSQDHEHLGVSYYDLRNKGDQIKSRDLKGTRLPPSSASLTS
ncbi:hypothetical protein JHK86_052617 [Glycine max]|nr:hypothetical protein JHK86_052617 [Glycine max]